MTINNIDLNSFVSESVMDIKFSGVILVKDEKEVIFENAYSYSNRSEEILNTVNTRFGIASGCKLFTAIAISQLVDKGILNYHTLLKDCLDIKFPYFDESISIHHLLTHSSGIPDYFDEDVMDNYEDLWKYRPMYQVKDLKGFLPMFQNKKMMFIPGERFHYNNAGFIILGLIIEQHTGIGFTEYIEKHIFQVCNMNDSGYFSLDHLPKNTALGYIENEQEGTWRTNIYSVPIKGGADGGAFITSPDMMKLWEGLFSYHLLSEKCTKLLLTPHIREKDDEFYGYGIWIRKRKNKIFKFHVMGYDPGVSFHSAFYPDSGIKIVIPSNKDYGPYKITKVIEDKLLFYK
ncbi:serine hydrolase domain-containing protein [Chengkuizengella marina]|uniref:Class C beta-lactamase-related serine hydrolase n=1 Tax=Chengkuizengella marina TaxID=2507566 RepID=A0A6N9PX13_9BACL|nr:serine hydrolase [Chengkuizengella marina]NBI27547.1 class C beta-lactamase-related serine hydrolase [Chengkuizengella marina]